jgi:putative methionine-R-sulfoxide reductase with GAF domain
MHALVFREPRSAVRQPSNNTLSGGNCTKISFGSPGSPTHAGLSVIAAKNIVTDQEKTPGLDEQTFGKLVEAAYVLQEHSREMRKMEESLELHSQQLREQESAAEAQFPRKTSDAQDNVPAGDYTLTLAEIVEAQHQIQRRHLALDPAMAVVAERVARITNASGAGIGLLDEKLVCYHAGAGAPALPSGTEVPLTAAVCAATVRTGQVIRSEDVSLEFLFDAEGCLKRGIQSLISVPIYHDGNIVGALELYFDRMRGFAEQDVHTCQLMAGLVTEAIGREAESSLKKSMASERSTMLEAIEKLKPNLAALAAQASSSTGEHSGTSADTLSCWRCDCEVLPVEQYCGTCGASRTKGGEPEDGEPSEMQNRLAAAWHEQQAAQASPTHARNVSRATEEPQRLASTQWDATDFQPEDALAKEQPITLPEWQETDAKLAQFLTPEPETDLIASPSSSSNAQLRMHHGEDDETSLVKLQQEDSTLHAAAAPEFPQDAGPLSAPNELVRFWQTRRGSFYLGVALFTLVVIAWGILSGDHPVAATSHATAIPGTSSRHKPPAADADLSMFDKFLISLGLADAPEAPQDKGNPDVQVWVDLHTALYYCPGSDLYGKTQKGRFASQHDAQLDQFEPALRKACD